MTITTQFKTDRKRYYPGIMFKSDIDDQGDIIFNYAGELGADTVSTMSVTTDDVTAGIPSISGNSVTIALSGFRDGVSKMEAKMITTAGKVLSSVVRFRATDYYNFY